MAAAVALAVTTTTPATGFDSTKDPDFAPAGTFRTVAPVGADRATAVAVQSTGKTILAGMAAVDAGFSYEGGSARRRLDGYVMRLLPDGSPDPGFGVDLTGIVRSLCLPDASAGATAGHFELTAVAVDSLDRIVVVGAILQPEQLVVIRLLPDGARDLAFGLDGRRDVDLPNGLDLVSVLDVVIDDLDNVYAAFLYQDPDWNTTDRGAAVARLRAADGGLDATWAAGGTAYLDPTVTGFKPSYGVATTGVAVAPDHGGVYLPGTWHDASYRPHPVVAKLNAAGAIDPSWGTGGLAVSSVQPSTENDYRAPFTDVAVQSDGKVLAAGWYDDEFDTVNVVQRFLPVGQPDIAYGRASLADIDTGRAPAERASRIEVDGAGYAFLSSTSGSYSFEKDTVVLRITDGGRLDRAFGDTGRSVITGLSALPLAVQADNKPVVASSIHHDSYVVRLTAAGAPDPDFGDDGGVLRNVGTSSDPKVGQAVTAPDGATFVAGQADGSMAVFRILPSSGLDPDFGERGAAVLQLGVESAADAVLLRPDGSLYVVGHTDADSYPYKGKTVLARLLPDGSLDPAFADGGVVVRSFDGSQRVGVAGVVQGANGPVVVGNTADWDPKLFIAAYTEAGDPDPTFDGAAQTMYATAAAVEADGSILVAGTSAGQIRLVRYRPDGVLDAAFNPQTGSMFELSDLVVQPDGRILITARISPEHALIRGVVARYLAAGAADPTFGIGGVATIPNAEAAKGLTLQHDGKILTGAVSWSRSAATRLHATGQVDTDYGQDGKSQLIDVARPFIAVDEAGYHRVVGLDGAYAITVVRLLGISPGPRPPDVFNVTPKEVCSIGHRRVTITGTGFTNVQQVLFDGEPSPYFRVRSSTELDAFSPEGYVELDGHVVVVNDVGPSEKTSKDHFDRLACYWDGTGDLKVSVAASASQPVGQDFTARVTVANDHDVEAILVDLTSKVPTGLSLVSAVASRGGCSGVAEVTCELGDFFGHDSVVVDFTLRAANAGTFPISWTAASPYGDDPTPSDNTASLTFTVGNGAGTTTTSTSTSTTTSTTTTVPLGGTTPPPPTTTTATSPKPGYWMLGSEGRVYAFGGVAHLGNASLSGAGAAVDIAARDQGDGYWVLDSTGLVHPFGKALYYGSAPPLPVGEHVTAISGTRSGRGYWIFTSAGRVIAYGDASHYGDMRNQRLNGPVLDSVAMPDDRGYYLVGADGGIFDFGTADFHGSMGGKPLNRPVNGVVTDPDNLGYWLVADDGGVFAFEAGFRGSMGGKPLNQPVIGMVAYGNGYLMVASDGGIFAFSDKPFAGSLGGKAIPSPIVAVAAYDG